MAIIDTSKITIPRGFFEEDLNVPKLFKWLYSQPTADVVPRDEVAKIFEAIEINIFKLETPYQTLHCIPRGFIEELKEKYTKGGAKNG